MKHDNKWQENIAAKVILIGILKVTLESSVLLIKL
jgi:hypothetical protein